MRLRFDGMTDQALLAWIGRCRWLVAAALLVLVALCLLWELALAPGPLAAWWALKALPLSLPLGGVLSHRLYTYRWLSLLIWLYAAEGALQLATADAPVRWLGLAECLLSLGVFAACVVYIQLRLQRGQRMEAAGVA